MSLGLNSTDHEVRCVKRTTLLETLSQQLPNSTIRYSSKVVSIEESGFFKLVHLADGTILKTKVKLLTFISGNLNRFYLE